VLWNPPHLSPHISLNNLRALGDLRGLPAFSDAAARRPYLVRVSWTQQGGMIHRTPALKRARYPSTHAAWLVIRYSRSLLRSVRILMPNRLAA
jgi:hypothetical protein